MKVAGLVQDSIVDGPGFRFTVFTQGCPHGCPGCHNPETHDPSGGTEVPVSLVIKKLLSNPLTDGVTLSGGEPFMQGADCTAIARAAHENGLNVWTYTGYTFERLIELSETDVGIKALLYETDVLVDGPFILEERSLSLSWRGSKNQRLLNAKKSVSERRPVSIE